MNGSRLGYACFYDIGNDSIHIMDIVDEYMLLLNKSLCIVDLHALNINPM